MSIYVFNLLVGFLPNGVDFAQGWRSKILKRVTDDVKHVYTGLPTVKYLKHYINTGINPDDMLSIHMQMTDDPYTNKFQTLEQKIEEISSFYGDGITLDYANGVVIRHNGYRIATIHCYDYDSRYVDTVHYYNKERLLFVEKTLFSVRYLEFYVTATDSNGHPFAKLASKAFYNKDGSEAFHIEVSSDEDVYIFPDGKILDEKEFLDEAIKRLRLSDKDIVIIDRFSVMNFISSLFMYGNSAKLIGVLHSDHYFLKNQDPYCINTNFEYICLFNNLRYFDALVVSTEGQKKSLEQFIANNGKVVPRIDVVPAGFIEAKSYNTKPRRENSIITVARLDPRKRVDLSIKAVVKAHETNPDITLDIYGNGDEYNTQILHKLVNDSAANGYVSFQGQQDLKNVYENYELFITTSLWETLGLGMMEAVSAGTAMLGLDTKYGNDIFVRDNENGRQIHVDLEDLDDPNVEQKVVDDLAGAIVDIFSDKDKLKLYHEKSYIIADEYLYDKIEVKWIELLRNFME